MNTEYLLDTHALIWLLEENKSLSTNALQVIESFSVKCYVSIASLWEMTIKSNLGKLQLPYDFGELSNALYLYRIQALQIRMNHLQTLQSLPLHHRDPFDRMLIAQAISNNFTLISKDPLFNNYPVKLLW